MDVKKFLFFYEFCSENDLLAQVFDDSALSSGAKDQMIRLYPDARRAHFKSGGNFPYLSRSAEVNLHIQVSLEKLLIQRQIQPEISSRNAHIGYI